MSQRKEQSRWQPPIGIELRKGQADLCKVIESKKKTSYTIQLPTGYGKSWCACISYALLKSQGRVNRCLIVVPTGTQRQQYINGLKKDLGILEINISDIDRCNGESWVIKRSFRNESEIFVTTVQSITSNPSYFQDLMSKGSWLLVADEFHHYGQENSWGMAIKQLPYEVILGMSATPIRGDKKQTIFLDQEFDVSVSIESARDENAIRAILALPCNYQITWSTLNEPDPRTALMTEMQGEAEGSLSEWEIKRGVRYYDKYVSSIFLEALNKYVEYEALNPGQNQILVFAMTCRHAEMITKVINDIAFPGLPKPFADWIGVGETDSGKRSEEENQAVLDAFSREKDPLPCLVQVNKAGEGFDNKRCSIGVFLDLLGDNPTKRQHIGRFMRTNKNVDPNLPSLIFVSEDSPSLSLLESLTDQFSSISYGDDDLAGENKGQGSLPKNPRDVQIPDLYIIDTKYLGQRRVYPYGSAERTLDVFVKGYEEETGQSVPEKEKPSILAYIDQKLDVQQGNQIPSHERQRELLKDQVNRNVGLLVNTFLRKRYGNNFPKNAKNDAFRSVNSRWKKINQAHEAMDIEDFKAKNNWLQEVLVLVKSGNFPTWLV